MSLASKVTASTRGARTAGDLPIRVGFAGHNLRRYHDFGSTRRCIRSMCTETETTRFWEHYEAGMRGGDMEMGFLIPGLDRYAETRFFGGAYYFATVSARTSPVSRAAWRSRALPPITLDAAYYGNKEIIGSNW